MTNKYIILFSLLLLLFSCGESSEEEEDNAVLRAQIALDTKDCAAAIDILESIGRKTKNPDYLQTLASAYACKTGYTETNFWTNDLDKIDTSATENILKSLVTFTTSIMTSASDVNYTDLVLANDVLLYLGGGIQSSSHASRETHIGAANAQNINLQLIFMLLPQIGKHLYYYGNGSSSTGNKGSDNPNGYTNECFYTYTGDARTLLGTITATPCDQDDAGHPDLTGASTSDRNSRMCELIVAFNNTTEVIANTEIPSSAGNVSSVSSELNTITSACTSALTASGKATDICTSKDQSDCETIASGDFDIIQLFYVAVFEQYYRN